MEIEKEVMYGAKVLILQREQLNQRRNPFY